MKHYEHDQFAAITLGGLGLGAAICVVVFLSLPTGEGKLATLVALAFLGACMLMFHSLHVEVGGGEVLARFGFGPIRRRIPLDEIRAVRPVRNAWWYGWGIRMVPGGWMFNVSGLDAVELELDRGRKFRIGTDEPRKLADAIERARAAG